MAVTMEALMVQLNANFVNFERQMKKASLITNQQMTAIDNRVLKTNDNLRKGLNPIPSFNTGNIAAQFQDIGVTAAMGMNPMIVALQQGTQLSAILNQSMAQGISPVRALGSAFLQVVNPVSLATLAVVGLATAAIQYFQSIARGGDESEEKLKKHEDQILQIAERWGDVVPALKEYAEKIEAQRQSAEAEAGRVNLIAENWRNVKQIIESIDGFIPLNTPETVALSEQQKASLVDLSAAYGDLQSKMQDGTATMQHVERVNSTLSAAINNVSIPALTRFANSWNTNTQAITGFIDKFHQARGLTPENVNADSLKAYVAEQEKVNAMSREELNLYREKQRVRKDFEKTGGVFSDADVDRQARANITAEERRRNDVLKERSSLRTGNDDVRQREMERQAVVDLIADLEHEYSLIGMTNKEREIANNLRMAGAAATTEETAQIREKTSATYDAREAEREVAAQARETAQFQKDLARGIIDGFRQGKEAADIFANALDKIADKLMNDILNNLFDSKSGGAGGGSIFGNVISGLSNFFGGARATGGPVSSGKAYLVGEKGPEMIVPRSAGMVIPNHNLNRMPMAAGGGGGDNISVNYAPVIDARGASPDVVPMIEAAMQAQEKRFMASLPARIKDAQRRSRLR